LGVASGDQALAVRGEYQGARKPLQGEELVSHEGVPDLPRVLHAARGQTAAVRTECRRVHPVLLPAQGVQAFPRGCFPHDHFPAVAGSHSLTICAEGDGRAPWALNGSQLFAGPGVPDLQLLPLVAFPDGSDLLAIRTEPQAKTSSAMSFEG